MTANVAFPQYNSAHRPMPTLLLEANL
jgi:hypothetical protein